MTRINCIIVTPSIHPFCCVTLLFLSMYHVFVSPLLGFEPSLVTLL